MKKTAKRKFHTSPIPIDPDQVYEMAKIHCTNIEIANVMGCSVDTITRRFADLLAKGRSECQSSIRRLQMDRCRRGSDAMLIHVGKNLLKQSDKIDSVQHTTHTVDNDDAIERIFKTIDSRAIIKTPG